MTNELMRLYPFMGGELSWDLYFALEVCDLLLVGERDQGTVK